VRYCTECGDEFQDWVHQCPRCHIDLLDGPKPDVKEIKQPVEIVQGTTLSRDELVTIASFSHAPEAYVTFTKLQAEGILSFIADDYMVTMNWLWSNVLHGVKIRVRESDVEAAVKILDSIPKELPEDNYESERCPECNSVDTRYYIFNLRAIYIIWLITFFISSDYGFPLPFFKFKWKCNKCGHQWRKNK
jgi:hypothetical protein